MSVAPLQLLDDRADDSGIPTYVISPSPMIWLHELEGVNEPRSMPIWREMDLAEHQRGSADLAGVNWPGPVLLPAHVIAGLVQAKRLTLPSGWARRMSRAEVTRFVAVLNAWRIDRTLVDFKGLAAEIALNSQVDITLTKQAFATLPTRALYIDFETLDFRERRMPAGAFIGFNCDEKQQLELVISVDWQSHARTIWLPLTGVRLDDLLSHFAARARRNGTQSDNWREVADFVDRHVHIIISAVLLVVQGASKMVHLGDGISRDDGHGLWTRYRMSLCGDEGVNEAYARAATQCPGASPVVVADWTDSDNPNTTPTLSCSISQPVR